MLIIALALQAAAPTADLERLGVALARQGMLASLLPVIASKETDELVAAHPELDAASKAELRRTASETYANGTERFLAAVGHEYARRLTASDMRRLIAFNATPAAGRYRAVQPQVIAGIMTTLGTLDMKSDTQKAFCAKTGKLCAAK